jgi:ubiquinone/menaquinone biosynthesis C-methylase UbiE
MITFDALAADYDAGRLGYSNDVYNTLVGYGLAPTDAILDIGCGTGLASGPLIENGYNVTGIDPSEPMLEVAKSRYPQARWLRGGAEQLPFGDGSFDATISAQALHHSDQRAALEQIVRVLLPGGIAAIWWKSLMSDDPAKQLRDAVAAEMGFQPLHSGWRGGFKEFYTIGFSQTAIRVIPWTTVTTLSRFMQYERSRKIVRESFGTRAAEYFERLESRFRETLGQGDPILPLSYTHFVYLAKK